MSEPNFIYVSKLPRLQILDQDDKVVLDFLSSEKIAYRMSFVMNLSHWSVKEPKYAD